MLGKIVTSALFAGFAAGLIAALLQLAFVQPVLLHAELYEGGELVHFGNVVNPVAQELPGLDLMRDGLSLLFSALTYTGYAFILVGAMALAEDRGHAVTARNGLIWGIAGFVTFQMAPAFGLAPELPGVAAAEIGPRQIWWFATAFATAAALGLIAFGKGWGAWIVAIVLLLLPHIVGAPQPDFYAGPVPPELASEFSARALGVGLAAWALLGSLAGFFWNQEGKAA